MCHVHVMGRFKTMISGIRIPTQNGGHDKNHSAIIHTSKKQIVISQREQHTAHHYESSRAGCLQMALAY